MPTTEISSSNFYQVTADMAASFRSAPIYVGPGSKHISLEVSWPATGTPRGAFTLEAANSSADATGAPFPATAATAWTSQQPAGSAGSAFLDNIETAALYVFVVYAATSGGTGAAATAIVGRGV